MENEIGIKANGKIEVGEKDRVDEVRKCQTKKYYVDFYDMFDGWGGFGFFPERLFDDLTLASKLCDELNEKLEEGNKRCGEHYGVIDSTTNREVYCVLDEKYKLKISELRHFPGIDLPILEKQDKKIDRQESDMSVADETYVDKPHIENRYQEVAEEIISVIEENLFDVGNFDKDQIVDILKRRFDINKEDIEKILMSDTTMFNIYSGETFTIPMFGMLAFARDDIRPVISGKIFPNYDLKNRYNGYTEDGVFRSINRWTEFIDSVRKNPMLVFASIVAGVSVSYTIIDI